MRPRRRGSDRSAGEGGLSSALSDPLRLGSGAAYRGTDTPNQEGIHRPDGVEDAHEREHMMNTIDRQ